MGALSILGKIVIVLVPVVIAVLVALSKHYESLGYSAQQMPAPPSTKGLLTEEQVAQYKQDGFLLTKALVTGDDLVKLKTASYEVVDEFFWTDAVIAKFYKKISFQTWKTKKEIARFAFESNLPSISAQLLDEKKSVRILKDAIFAHSVGKGGCGFHVDDTGFWPAENSNGVTFWIALSPMRISEGGGIRLAKGSHTAEWALECREAIKNNKTCSIDELHPACNERLYEVSETYDMEPGDALIWDRYLFHRGDPFHAETDERKLRYTIRYVPEGATAAGFHHGSVKTGAPLHGPHYPQVWPKTLEDEVEGFAGFGNSFIARLLPIF